MKTTPLAALCLLLAMAGCATTPKTSFYLVPDPEGHVGEVTVANQSGDVTLNKANETVSAESGTAAFTESRVANPEEIQTKFAGALELVPPTPKGFNIYFDMGSSKVNADSMAALDQVIGEARQRDSRDISLNGHTDRTGEDAVNMRLSLDRANTVKNLLVEKGILADYLTVEYYGESKPVVPTADNVAEPKNRRVEVVVR